jgi:hypothetical protein
MSKAEHNADPVDPVAERYARLEALQRRAAEHGITIHIPARDAGEWQPPEVLFPYSADEVSEMVVRLRRGELMEERMTNPAPETDPNLEHAPDLLVFQRRAADLGLQVRLPAPNPDWDLPEPVDLGGASLGDMVVRLRRADP